MTFSQKNCTTRLIFKGLQEKLSEKICKTLLQDGNLVPIQIIEYDCTQNRGNKKNSTEQLTEHQRQSAKAAPKYFDQTSLFKEAEKRNTNFVSVIGEAGIGKTVLAKDLAKNYAAQTPSTADGPYVFYIPLKGVNFQKRVNVLQFLITPLLSDWESNEERDRRLTRLLNESSNVYIFIDGLDEIDGKLLKNCPKDINLYDSCCPAVIMQSLLSEKILPKAKKLVTSRPAAFLHLHHECIPKFNLRILGLSQEAQKKLCLKICKNDEKECNRVLEALDSNLDFTAISYVPFSFEMIVRYLRKQPTSTLSQTTTLTDLFTETFARYVRSPHLRSETNSLKKLIELAMEGMKEDKFTFHFDEIPRNTESTKDFLQAEAHADINHPDEEILEGDKIFSFTHMLWQEYFAAIQLMFFADAKTILSFEELEEDERWVKVLRFAFGFQKVSAKRNIERYFHPPKLDLFSQNTKYLKELVLLTVQKGFIVESCAYAFEAHNQSLAETICQHFPDTLKFSEIYDPSEFMAISFVLRCKKLTPRQIYMWDFFNSFVFRGRSLQTLLDAVNDNGHKVRKKQSFGNPDLLR